MSCERETHHWEESFIVRFAADACEDVRLTNLDGRDLEAGGRIFQRTYEADSNCITSLRKGMSDLGFSRDSFDTFSFKMDEDSLEKIIIKPHDGNSNFEIRWEETSS